LTELAHCIKNIMHAVGGGSYILDAGLNTSDLAKAAKGWDIVKRNNEFLKQLVLDMLSYSKEREPGSSVVDINETCESACRLFKDMARSKATEIVFEKDPSVGTVAVDKTSIKRCLNNLLRNAVEACGDDGGIVRIATGSNHEKDEFVIRIQDNGCGISEENKPKLFQVFFSTKGSMGTGLGLAVVHKIITEHRGRIEVESEVGKGTTFIITLPKEPPKTK
jgi:signal transduction histidine kinase